MTKIGIQHMTTLKLTERYASSLIRQYEIRNRITSDGRADLRMWNGLAAEIEAAHRMLLSRDGGLAALRPLLRHNNPNVRYSAALHLLEHGEKDALTILDEMARATELPAFYGDVKSALRNALEHRWIIDRLLSADRVGISNAARGRLKEANTSRLVDILVGLLLEQYAVSDRHDERARPDLAPWNRLADQINVLEREIKARGDEGVSALLLIRHSNPNVRYAAAVQCLKQRAAEVLPVLEEMARTNDFRETRIDPGGALVRWREGKWAVS